MKAFLQDGVWLLKHAPASSGCGSKFSNTAGNLTILQIQTQPAKGRDDTSFFTSPAFTFDTCFGNTSTSVLDLFRARCDKKKPFHPRCTELCNSETIRGRIFFLAFCRPDLRHLMFYSIIRSPQSPNKRGLPVQHVSTCKRAALRSQLSAARASSAARVRAFWEPLRPPIFSTLLDKRRQIKKWSHFGYPPGVDWRSREEGGLVWY